MCFLVSDYLIDTATRLRTRYEENHGSFHGIYFIFSTEARPHLGPNHFPIKSVTKILSQGLKLSGCEDNHQRPSNTMAMKAWSSASYTSSWCDDCDSNFIMYSLHSVHKISRHTEY